MCDEGRFDTGYINDSERIQQPMMAARGASLRVPRVSASSWDKVLPALREDLTKAVADKSPPRRGRVVALSHGEEGYLLARFFKGLSRDCVLYLGWVPVLGEDDRYPKDRKGRPTSR